MKRFSIRLEINPIATYIPGELIASVDFMTQRKTIHARESQHSLHFSLPSFNVSGYSLHKKT